MEKVTFFIIFKFIFKIILISSKVHFKGHAGKSYLHGSHEKMTKLLAVTK